MEYIQSSNTIIISHKFNKKLTDENLKFISKFNKVIFSDYKLNNLLFKAYENYKLNNLLVEPYENYKSNIFCCIICNIG